MAMRRYELFQTIHWSAVVFMLTALAQQPYQDPAQAGQIGKGASSFAPGTGEGTGRMKSART